ncbi:hypothetical protein CVT24_013390 [Panaeolus cyanescens]|uniref:Uncharacterized protein n=1 Tax=Panaeolus cyanescens TaxID=181874 RepID=A0A409YMQ2_9AGAR|nr:hypothetical protein CVT24_013390 [Panaeolus cyanescens]
MRSSSSILLSLAFSLICYIGFCVAMPITQKQQEEGSIVATMNQELINLSHHGYNHEQGRPGQTSVTPGHTQVKTYGPAGNAVAVDSQVDNSPGGADKLPHERKGQLLTPVNEENDQPKHTRPHYTLQSLNQYLSQFANGHAAGPGIIPDGASSRSPTTGQPAKLDVEIIEEPPFTGTLVGDAEFD